MVSANGEGGSAERWRGSGGRTGKNPQMEATLVVAVVVVSIK